MSARLQPISSGHHKHLDNGSSGKWDLIRSITIGVDEAATSLERRWGVGRLIRLVSSDTRTRFHRGSALWSAALAESDLEAVRDLGPKMIAAWRFMDSEAAAAGHQHLVPEAFEALTADGRVIVVVRTSEEAHAVQRDGRACVVWTMAELARVLPTLDLVNEIKRTFEGARVDRVTSHAPEFAGDWAAGSSFLSLHELEDA